MRPADDEVRGAELVKRSCEADNAGGCELYARAFERGMGVAVDADAFHRYMHRACDLGAGGGCRSFALSFDNDDPQRIPLLEKACTLDDTIGCMGLGAAYLNGGQGVAKDLAKAKSWYEKAASQGEPDIQMTYGLLHANGLFGDPDYGIAEKWIERAARQGHVPAQLNLAILQAQGLSGTADVVSAMEGVVAHAS